MKKLIEELEKRNIKHSVKVHRGWAEIEKHNIANPQSIINHYIEMENVFVDGYSIIKGEMVSFGAYEVWDQNKMNDGPERYDAIEELINFVTNN